MQFLNDHFLKKSDKTLYNAFSELSISKLRCINKWFAVIRHLNSPFSYSLFS